jgi:hypothetical protein
MTDLTREQALEAIENGWGTYVRRFGELTPTGQREFLHKQGYDRLADLLGHVIAWWTDGQQKVQDYLKNPDLPQQEYDVDGFNAKAVAKFKNMPEEEVIRLFEEKRAGWIKLVKSLPDAAFQNEKLRARLHIEVVGHLEEHLL